VRVFEPRKLGANIRHIFVAASVRESVRPDSLKRLLPVGLFGLALGLVIVGLISRVSRARLLF
jgi:hypothetical protein